MSDEVCAVDAAETRRAPAMPAAAFAARASVEVTPRARAALAGKRAWTARAGVDLYVVTQFGFDPQAVIDREAGLRREGLRVPVHVGLAGPTPLQRPIRYAMQCGIGASLRTIANRTSAMAHLATVPGPEEMLAALARHCADTPNTCIVQPHLFAFGGIEATVRWLAERRAEIEGAVTA